MHLMTKTVAPALRALLENLIDYAGLFPPAGLPLESALANYSTYKGGDFSWMLRYFVINSADLERVPASLDGSLSLISPVDHPRAASIEASAIIRADRPVYCEVAPADFNQLDAVQQAGNFAKIRTGGIKPEAIPSPAQVAAFIKACAERRLPFKATAGLHHPVRKEYALTYQADAPRAVMHGFLNVLMASAFAWQGEGELEPILSETDARAFSFDDRAHWNDRSLSIEQVKEARRKFMHAIGSCSFEEPVHDLQALGLF